MIASTGPVNAAIDMAAAGEHGIHVGTSGGSIASTVELTWALILAASRGIVPESMAVRRGHGRHRWAASRPGASSGFWVLAGSVRGSLASAPPSAWR
ncbi:MAG TPA: hypothetical protein VMU34_09320 [Mycobacterium sp.]|nr:hypothetical protein [Mycobacterium sp.]